MSVSSKVRSSEIPDKLYFRIGEVAKLCDVEPYVLRFWESEFPQLKPNKGGTGQRLYRRRDVEMALRVKKLLYEEGYTIAGARQLLKAEVKQPAPQLPLRALEQEKTVDRARLQRLKNDLEEIARLLARPVPGKVGQPSLVRSRQTIKSSEATAAKPNLF